MSEFDTPILTDQGSIFDPVISSNLTTSHGLEGNNQNGTEPVALFIDNQISLPPLNESNPSIDTNYEYVLNDLSYLPKENSQGTDQIITSGEKIDWLTGAVVLEINTIPNNDSLFNNPDDLNISLEENSDIPQEGDAGILFASVGYLELSSSDSLTTSSELNNTADSYHISGDFEATSTVETTSNNLTLGENSDIPQEGDAGILFASVGYLKLSSSDSLTTSSELNNTADSYHISGDFEATSTVETTSNNLTLEENSDILQANDSNFNDNTLLTKNNFPEDPGNILQAPGEGEGNQPGNNYSQAPLEGNNKQPGNDSQASADEDSGQLSIPEKTPFLDTVKVGWAFVKGLFEDTNLGSFVAHTFLPAPIASESFPVNTKELKISSHALINTGPKVLSLGFYEDNVLEVPTDPEARGMYEYASVVARIFGELEFALATSLLSTVRGSSYLLKGAQGLVILGEGAQSIKGTVEGVQQLEKGNHISGFVNLAAALLSGVSSVQGLKEMSQNGTRLLDLSLPSKTPTPELLPNLGSYRELRLPNTDNTITSLGYTSIQGDIFLRPGLSWSDMRHTLRHESVHAFLSARGNSYIARLRQNLAWFGWENSHLLRFTEEAIAETYATRSLIEGLIHPVRGDYATIRGVATEATIIGAVYLGAAYLAYLGGYQLANGK